MCIRDRLGMFSIRPSDSSCLKASRTGVLLTSYCLQTACSVSLEFAGSLPLNISFCICTKSVLDSGWLLSIPGFVIIITYLLRLVPISYKMCIRDRIEGIERIRFMTSNPKDLSDDLIDCFRTCNKLCKHCLLYTS